MKPRVIKFTDKFEMSRVPIDESSSFADKNEIETPSVKSEDESTPKNIESAHCYPLRKNSPPPYFSLKFCLAAPQPALGHY